MNLKIRWKVKENKLIFSFALPWHRRVLKSAETISQSSARMTITYPAPGITAGEQQYSYLQISPITRKNVMPYF